MKFISRRFLCVLLALALFNLVLPAMSEEEHKSHHPEAQDDQSDDQAGMGGMMGGGMMEKMGGMMEKMGAPKPKDLYPSLMSVPEFSDEQKAILMQQAEQRMQLGTKGMTESAQLLISSNERQDFEQMQLATDSMQESLALFESGLATKRAIKEGMAPQQVAMQWFKQEMNLLPPAGHTSQHGLFGWSWFHTSIMFGLILFFVCMIGMYFFKMRRASELLDRLTFEPSAEKHATEVVPDPQLRLAEQQADPVTSKWEGELYIAAMMQETHNVKTLRLQGEKNGDVPFSFLPGQFAQVILNIDDKKTIRSYTIASSPTNRAYIDLTIKREEQGDMSRHIHDQLKEGGHIQVKAPMGAFTFTDLNAPGVVLIAGGVGVTPMMSILRYLYDKSWDKPIYLLYCCRSVADYIFKEELELLQKRYPQLHLLVTMTRSADEGWTGPHGRLSYDVVVNHVPDLEHLPIHICGPVPMMDDIKEQLIKGGISAEHIKTESFGGKSGERHSESDKSKPIDKEFGVTFSQSDKIGKSAGGETVLEVAEECGVEIENSCRTGTCGMCKVKLLDGAVAMECEDALDDHEREQGIILACQAVPQQDVRVDV